MNVSWDDLAFLPEQPVQDAIHTHWKWLLEQPMPALMVSRAGDAFLEAPDGLILWLQMGEGYVDVIFDSKAEFDRAIKSPQTINTYFHSQLIVKLKTAGRRLAQAQVHGFVKHPVLGGSYEPQNFAPMDATEHFRKNGQLHQALNDGANLSDLPW